MWILAEVFTFLFEAIVEALVTSGGSNSKKSKAALKKVKEDEEKKTIGG